MSEAVHDPEELARLRQARIDLLSLLREAREAIKARDDLLVCYRLGKRVTETLFDRLEKSDKSIACIDAYLENGKK